MRTARALMVWAVACLAVAGCSQGGAPGQAEEARVVLADAGPPARAPTGTFLAYEHSVEVKLAGDAIAARLAAVQSACFAQKFGDCAVLQVDQGGGQFPYGNITVRIDPKGVEPLLGTATAGGEVVSRTLRAEDLADAVADNTLRRSRLEKERARLLEFQDRPAIKLEDMLALSRRLSEVEAALDEAQQQLRRWCWCWW